jgi:hypothetical protein
MRKLLCLLAVFICLGHKAIAQSSADLQTGARIKVTSTKGKTQTGKFMGASHDSLFYSTGGSSTGPDVSLRYGEVVSVKVSRGRSAARGMLTKGLFGTAIGGATGILVGILASDRLKNDPWLGTPNQSEAAFGFLGGLIGFTTGTIVGAVHGNERWEEVALPRAR